MKSIKNIISLFALSLILSSCGMQSIPQGLNDVEAAWSEVQNQYKRRSDLIPNLVSTVKGYAKHEQETLEGVVSARSKATQVKIDASKLNGPEMKKFEEAQQGLSGAISRLLMVSEKYPDLKANTNFQDLQAQLEGTENRIAVARNRYIQSIKNFNNLITVPPTSWYNSLFLKHEKKPQFELAPEEAKAAQEAPKVEF